MGEIVSSGRLFAGTVPFRTSKDHCVVFPLTLFLKRDSRLKELIFGSQTWGITRRLPINEDTSPPVNEPTWQEIKDLGRADGADARWVVQLNSTH